MKAKYFLLIVASLMLSAKAADANNLKITNVGTEVIGDLSYVTFNLSWENSWRVSYAPGNYDAAWVFMKRVPTPYTSPVNIPLQRLVVLPDGFSYNIPTDNTGIFIYRTDPGFGNVDITVKLAIPSSMVFSTEVHVFGLEMVYIPTGAFRVGLYANALGSTYSTMLSSTGSSSYPIAGDASTVIMGTGIGELNDPFGNGALNASFPTGYNGFYVMKYELSVEAYRDFLNLTGLNNSLLTTQSAAQVNASVTLGPRPLKVKTINASQASNSLFRYTFGCDDDTDGVFDEDMDGFGVPVIAQSNWVRSFLSFANLRPMTELEYEKACFGANGGSSDVSASGISLIPNGTNIILINKGSASETLSGSTILLPTYAYGNVLNTGLGLPVRSACMSITGYDISKARQFTGGSYYGVMDLSGNVSEPCVSTSDASNRASFTGSVSGFVGYTFRPRGGSYAESYVYAAVLRRDGSASYMGIRGAR
jgi:formylglycine-generating enzyme required for sulfatase activity